MKKCHYCKRKNSKGFTSSMAPDNAEFCSVDCIEKHADKKFRLEEKAEQF